MVTQPVSGRAGLSAWQVFNRPVRWRTRTTTTAAQPKDMGTSLSVFTPRRATPMLVWGLSTPTSQQESIPRRLLDVVTGDAEGGGRLQTPGTAREISGRITSLGRRTSGFSFWSVR